MKNRTMLRMFSVLLTVFMLAGMFALYATAEKKVVYNDEQSIVEYDEGVVTVKLNAEKIGAIINERRFNRDAFEELLPDGIYRIINERSKAALVDAILNLANKQVFTYDEMVNVFGGDEKIMKKYINLDLFSSFFTNERISTALVKLYNDGKMEELLAVPGLRDTLYTLLSVDNDAAIFADAKKLRNALVDIEIEQEIDENKELQVLLPIRELTDELAIRNAIKAASGATIKTKTRGVIEQVLFGEVDKIFVDETVVYEDEKFDHNAIRTAILLGLPPVVDLTTIADGDVFADYEIRTTGPNVALNFGFKVEFFGDTSVINQKAETVNAFFEYAVETDGLITATVTLDERFSENYTKVLESAVPNDRKAEYLSLYTADAETMKDHLSGDKFEQFLEDAKTAGVQFSEKIDAQKSRLTKIRDYLLRASNYASGYTTLDDAYQGNGVFVLNITETIPLAKIEEKIHSRFASIEEVMDWLKQDDHIIDTQVTFEIEDFYRVRFFDADENLIYVTYLPEGTAIYDEDATILDVIPELQNYGPVWVDAYGNPVNEVGDDDLDLYTEAVLKEVPIVKLWEDDFDRDGIRPDEITIRILADGVEAGYVDMSAEGYVSFIRNLDAEEDDPTTGFPAGVDPTIGNLDDDDDDDDWDDDEEPNVWYASVDLPIRRNGQVIEYTFVEDDYNGYASDVRIDQDGTVTVTNTHETEDTHIIIKKVWDDSSNQDGKRPESIVLKVFANGELFDTVTIHSLSAEALNEAGIETSDDDLFADMMQDGSWYVDLTYKAYEDGQRVVYTIAEEPVEGYASRIEENVGEYDYVITNSYTTETTEVTVTKTWDDDDNRDGIRPRSVEITLIGNELEYGTALLTEANQWTCTFENLPRYCVGEVIDFTVVETPVDGYITAYDVAQDGTRIVINTHIPETVVISGTKVWNDPNTKDQKRPASITVILLANGEEVARQEVTGEGDSWEFSFEPQPKYENGVEIEYTIDEVDVEGYNKQINGYEIVNSGVFAISMFVLATLAAAGGVFAAVRVIKKRKDQE